MFGYPFYLGFGYGVDPAYLLLVVVSLVLGVLTQGYINSSYRKWSRVPSDGESGEQVARRMLDANGCSAVGIRHVAGHLTDHYDPRDNNLYLSGDNLSGGSVASVAVACHEAGHAAQRESGYFMMKVRHALVPVVNFSQNAWMLIFLMGVFTNLAGLTTIAIALFAFSVLFQLVTLPVEFDASRRAIAFIESSGMGEVNARGARQVLTAAALTYVAAALTSVLQLLYILGRSGLGGDEE
ncbi:MAG: zinc metallopeptidase [Collinsella sp.]|nr:zinc metallopeptidase [Collinsella sp.]